MDRSDEPIRENVDAERDATDFLRTSWGEGWTVPVPLGEVDVERRVDRKHSSHWAKTRGVTVSRSSIADRMVNCSWMDRIGDFSDDRIFWLEFEYCSLSLYTSRKCTGRVGGG